MYSTRTCATIAVILIAIGGCDQSPPTTSFVSTTQPFSDLVGVNPTDVCAISFQLDPPTGTGGRLEGVSATDLANKIFRADTRTVRVELPYQTDADYTMYDRDVKAILSIARFEGYIYKVGQHYFQFNEVQPLRVFELPPGHAESIAPEIIDAPGGPKF